MDIAAVRNRAKLLDEVTQTEMAKPSFKKVMAWFGYLGLLRHNTIEGRRVCVTLAEVLHAGEIEPRVFELLPALMIHLPEAMKFNRADIPQDLAEVQKAIKRHAAKVAFRGIPPHKYLHWLTSPILEQAARRLRYHTLPRDRSGKGSKIAEVIRQARIDRALTQKQLAESYGLSLRVIRDLEQGKLTASLQNVIDVLRALDRTLSVQ